MTTSVFTINMASQGEDDLQASTTEGFKVGEKKTVEEYAKLGECMKLTFRRRAFTHFHLQARYLLVIFIMPSLRRIKSVQDLYIMLDNLMPLKRCQLSYYDVENFFKASIWESSCNYPPPLFSCKHLPSLRNNPRLILKKSLGHL